MVNEIINKRYMKTIRLSLLILTLLFQGTIFAQVKYSKAPSKKACYELIERVVPGRSGMFEVKFIPQEDGKDVFEVASTGKKIILSGNDGVSIASALNYYLKNYCNFEITWNNFDAERPSTFPLEIESVRKVSPHTYRYYLNYCTFSYSMAWWDWKRWEKEIDWMALNGINMPLAITGQEAIWQRVYSKFGLSAEDLSDFFTGPAYFGWFYMNNMDGWGGPLPQSWIDSHEVLQKQILKRESELGMKPVLPAFTGHVPKSYVRHNPEALVDSVYWHGQIGYNTYMLNPNDERFAAIGKAFLEEQKKAYGTSHYYSSDIFNEMMPPSNKPEYLAQTSHAVYASMQAADPEAVWVMQGWLFVSADGKKFWTPERMKPFLDAVPNDNMIILELYSENRPRWRDTEAYYGKPWIWNMLHNFGGNLGLFGKAPFIAHEPARMLKDKKRGALSGIGLTMEAIEQNPMIYHLMLEHVWRSEPIDVNNYISGWIKRRYGAQDEDALKAWEYLLRTVYRTNKKDQGPAESSYTGRPTFNENSAWTWTDLYYYSNRDFAQAWKHMILASDNLTANDGFSYDLVDITRQAMSNYATTLHRQAAYTYWAGDIEGYERIAAKYLELLTDIDRLLGTREEFLFGKWLDDAKKWATNDSERVLYEMNARDLVTVWGRKDCPEISDYSCRQWNGLVKDYYMKRWNDFFSMSTEALKQGKPWDQTKFYDYIREWSWSWVNSVDGTFATEPSGDPIAVAKEMYDKYFDVISRSEVKKQSRNELD
jgi:alpha-N-acetylglucosaminidase